MKANFNKGGFTLLEVTLSILIFGLVAGGVLMGFIQGERIAEIESHRISAMNIARAKAEFLKSLQFNDVTSGSVSITSEYPYLVSGYSDINPDDRPVIDSGPTSGMGDDLLGYTYVQVKSVTVSVGTNSFSGKEVTVTVAWTESGNQIKERLDTLLTENNISGG